MFLHDSADPPMVGSGRMCNTALTNSDATHPICFHTAGASTVPNELPCTGPDSYIDPSKAPQLTLAT